MANLRSETEWGKDDGYYAYTCNMVHRNLGAKAKDIYRCMFSNTYDNFYSYPHLPIAFGLVSGELITSTRVAAIELFELIALEEQLYKEF